MDRKVRTTVELSEKLHKAVRKLLIDNGKSFSRWINEQMEKYVKENK